MEHSVSDMNNRFNHRLSELLTTKNQNTQILTKASYLNMIEKVNQSKMKQTPKLPEEYQRLRRYDVVLSEGVEKLIVPATEGNYLKKYYVHTEEIFHILHHTHTSLVHGGRNRMEKEINHKYKNITREMIVIYLSFCEVCQKKVIIPKKTLAVKLTQSTENVLESRCQVELIDMQSKDDDEYKFILVYQDYLTKFIQLRPLKTNTPKEVATSLLDIFTIFGAPNILQSNNGREFGNNIIEELWSMWQELKMVLGNPGEDTEDRTNQDIENMLSVWLESNHTKKWSEGLKFVQFMRNSTHHAAINKSPCEATFGSKLNLGLKTFLPPETLTNINTEEELHLFLKKKLPDSNIYCDVSIVKEEDVPMPFNATSSCKND